MVKLIIFDLDGVLLDAKEMHYVALNKAISRVAGDKFMISIRDHIQHFDGLPTRRKLEMLTAKTGLQPSLYDAISKAKQEETILFIKSNVSIDYKLKNIFEELIKKNIKICVASNSVRATVRQALISLGIIEYVDYYYSNEDVSSPKPHSEIYLRCMSDVGVNPSETLIVEDSEVGRQAVYNSGATLLAVDSTEDVQLDVIMNKIDSFTKRVVKQKWSSSNMNVLIPMSGRGSRFENAGYTFPKPLIEVLGKPMIQLVVENLNIDANYIFVVQKSHYEKYNLKYMLNLICPNCTIVQVDGVTEGAACTTLAAREFIDNNNQLLIANSDQYVEWNSSSFMYEVNNSNADGAILTFKNTHPKWSFARTDENNRVLEVAEKRPISDNASVGIYWWKLGSDYVKYSDRMISKNIRVNNEFYVAPVFNEAIVDNKIIKSVNIPSTGMWGLGTPEDLSTFISSRRP